MSSHRDRVLQQAPTQHTPGSGSLQHYKHTPGTTLGTHTNIQQIPQCCTGLSHTQLLGHTAAGSTASFGSHQGSSSSVCWALGCPVGTDRTWGNGFKHKREDLDCWSCGCPHSLQSVGVRPEVPSNTNCSPIRTHTLRPTGQRRTLRASDHRPAHPPHFRPRPHPCARTRPGPSRGRRARRRRRSICRKRAVGYSGGRRGAAAGPGRPAAPARRAVAAGGVRTAPGCERARR